MDKLEKEKEIISLMIKLYCYKNHNNNDGLCYKCEELLEYAHKRLDNCRYGDKKTTCKKCSTHCYKSDMREMIKEVMRFSGPRMMVYRPHEYIKHIAK